jgi:hypothetical protein
MSKVYQKIASTVQALKNCIDSNNEEWHDKHLESIKRIEKDFLPSGSGIDSGCQIDIQKSLQHKIVINSGYHIMNQNGYYDGWIDFKVIITPSFQDFNLKIIGPFSKLKDPSLKEYLEDIFSTSLLKKIESSLK